MLPLLRVNEMQSIDAFPGLQSEGNSRTVVDVRISPFVRRMSGRLPDIRTSLPRSLLRRNLCAPSSRRACANQRIKRCPNRAAFVIWYNCNNAKMLFGSARGGFR